MIHNFQKRWVFTWNADLSDQIIEVNKLEELLNEIAKEGVFQKERGEKTNRIHYQGRFELKGPRIGKKQLLKIFSQIYDVKNLTFEPERLYDSTNYCIKLHTRVGGPWYVGTDLYRTKNSIMTIKLYKWQEQLLNELKSPLGETFKQRKVIWIQDPTGGSGKSTFIKYLSLSKNELAVKKLPLDKPDRLRMMICKILENENVDIFMFDFTRTLGVDTHLENLFQIIEEIKNGHIVSAMYGSPMEAIFSNPHVIIFTNNDISHYCHYLSMDRWQAYEIQNKELFEIKKIANYAFHDLNSRYISLNEKTKKV